MATRKICRQQFKEGNTFRLIERIRVGVYPVRLGNCSLLSQKVLPSLQSLLGDLGQKGVGRGEGRGDISCATDQKLPGPALLS